MGSMALRLGIACVVALGLAACGNDNPTTMIMLPDGGGATDSGTSTGTDSGTGGTDSGTTVDMCADRSDCSACPDQNSCGTCCTEAEEAANAELLTGLVANCACTAAATCEAACAADGICADPAAMPSSACVTCLNGVAQTDPCVQATVTACQGSATCLPILMCFQGC